MPSGDLSMTGTQFQNLLDSYGLRHVDAAKLLRCTTRTVERYVAAKTVPHMAVAALRWELQEAGQEPVERKGR
jgi:hypothetical protein